MKTRLKKKEVIFEVPVTTDKVEEFTRQQVEVKQTKKPPKDYPKELLDFWYEPTRENLFANIAEKISSQVNEQLPNFGSTIHFDKNSFNEFVKNCFDAYAKKGLKIGDHLQIKLVIQEKDDKVIIKIKDNGYGLKNREKGERFEHSAMKEEDYEAKDEKLLGKQKLGIKAFAASVKKIGGHVFLKNRKNEGASIEVELPSSAKLYDDMLVLIYTELTHLYSQKNISRKDRKICKDLMTLLESDEVLIPKMQMTLNNLIDHFNKECKPLKHSWLSKKQNDPIEIINNHPDKYIFSRGVGLILKEFAENPKYKNLLNEKFDFKIDDQLSLPIKLGETSKLYTLEGHLTSEEIKESKTEEEIKENKTEKIKTPSQP